MDKSNLNFKIQYDDGRIVDLHEKGIWVSDFDIPSPSPEHLTETLEGRHGSILLETQLRERKIRAFFSVEGSDIYDFDMLRDELFKIFDPLDSFYIIRDIQPKKRIRVSLANDYNINYLSPVDGEFPIEFICHSVFFESVGTTLHALSFDSNVWQVGQGISTADAEYVHQNPQFKIYNAGDVDIDPRQFPLKITYKGISSGLTISNKTTKETWSYTGNTVMSDTLSIEGIRSLLNGQSVFRDTNKKLLTIKKGWNDFEITGASDFLISFDFRFYYF